MASEKCCTSSKHRTSGASYKRDRPKGTTRFRVEKLNESAMVTIDIRFSMWNVEVEGCIICNMGRLSYFNDSFLLYCWKGLKFVYVVATDRPVVSFLGGSNSIYISLPTQVLSSAFNEKASRGR